MNTTPRPVLLVPGIQNSGPTHWQSRWEALHAGVARVEQRDWNHPDCDEWAATLEQAVRRAAQAPIIVAHSLGCLATARWASQSSAPLHAALLVAVPDPQGPSFPVQARGFMPLPPALPGRRITMLASANDPYSDPGYTRTRATAWGAELVELGALGHLNAASGLGDWPEAWARVARWRRKA